MDKQRRKQLKLEGKRLQEARSAELTRRLAERNPFELGDPRWAQNILAEYKINRSYRQNRTEVIREEVATENSDVRTFEFHFDEHFFPKAGWYIRCSQCRCLVPSLCTEILACECEAVRIDPIAKRVRLPTKDQYSVVELSGRGPIRKGKWFNFSWLKL